MSGTSRLVVTGLTALVIGVGATPAAADPDHPRCSTTTIENRADLPLGYSIRAIQDGLNYPTWCR